MTDEDWQDVSSVVDLLTVLIERTQHTDRWWVAGKLRDALAAAVDCADWLNVERAETEDAA